GGSDSAATAVRRLRDPGQSPGGYDQAARPLRRRDAQRRDGGRRLAQQHGPAVRDRELGLVERERERDQRLLVEIGVLGLRDGLTEDRVGVGAQPVERLGGGGGTRRGHDLEQAIEHLHAAHAFVGLG